MSFKTSFILEGKAVEISFYPVQAGNSLVYRVQLVSVGLLLTLKPLTEYSDRIIWVEEPRGVGLEQITHELAQAMGEAIERHDE